MFQISCAFPELFVAPLEYQNHTLESHVWPSSPSYLRLTLLSAFLCRPPRGTKPLGKSRSWRKRLSPAGRKLMCMTSKSGYCNTAFPVCLHLGIGAGFPERKALGGRNEPRGWSIATSAEHGSRSGEVRDNHMSAFRMTCSDDALRPMRYCERPERFDAGGITSATTGSPIKSTDCLFGSC